MNARGYSPKTIISVIISLIIVGLCLPILDPFLQMGITATGGITAMVLMLIPIALVLAVLIRIVTGEGQYAPPLG